MISFIKGIAADIGEDFVVLENQGIGYLIRVPATVPASGCRLGEAMTLYTHMHVREDELSLFGFLTKDALTMFEKLITVNGIGPKVALAILSALDVSELMMAVLSGDVKALTRANGLGTKGAQRIIMELKDKLDFEDAFVPDGRDAGDTPDARSEAVEALSALGYSNSEALAAVRKLGDTGDMDAEAILKAALRKLI